MIELSVILLILIPLIAGALIFILPKRFANVAAFLAAVLNFFFAAGVFNKEGVIFLPWAGFGMDFSLRVYAFSGFIILAAAFFSLLIALYSLGFSKNAGNAGKFASFLLISLSFVNGAVLADNLVLLLFFWEGLLLTLYGMIYMGGSLSFRTATKAFIIVGISDLCLMAGVGLTGYLAKSLVISDMGLSLHGLGSIAFILLVIGAIAKAGCMPFHTWIPDAAEDAPLGFMAFFPAAIEKLIGIYFLSRITLDMFRMNAESNLSYLLMAVGALTIIAAVMMALVQKDYKRLLSYHAISQVGYMILGIGTCLPAGIIGGLFHMVNNAVYKCGLFLTAGSVEKQAGSTNLEKLGGLRAVMPVTFFSFIICAASISGVPPFNGFFSKELIYDAALQRGAIFYIAAIVGSFFTAASFLKLGHAVFVDKARGEHRKIKEAPVSMLAPMIILSVICILFGLFSSRVIDGLIRPGIALHMEGKAHAGPNWLLIIISLVVLSAAIIQHIIAAKLTGKGLKAAEHIHNAPVLSVIYRWQEKKYFDPYELGRKALNRMIVVLWSFDRAIDWIYDSFLVKITYAFSRGIRKAHSGYYITYVIWSLLGALCLLICSRY